MDLFKEGGGLILVNKHMKQIVHDIATKKTRDQLSKIDSSLRSRCLKQDLSYIDYALRLVRVNHDRIHLQLLLKSIVETESYYYNNPTYRYEVGIGYLYFLRWPMTRLDTFTAYDYLESTAAMLVSIMWCSRFRHGQQANSYTSP